MWLTGLSWTDRPDNKSRVISAFSRAFNDYTDQAGRDALDKWQIDNAERLLATADDEHDDERGLMATDWATRVALPMWLDLAGARDAAALLRAHGTVDSREQAAAIRTVIVGIQKELPDWTALRADLRRRVREAVTKALKEKAGAAGAAEAAEAAEAAGAAEAAFRDRVYKTVRAKLLEVWGERFEPTTTEVRASAFELLERMLAIGEA